MLFRFALAAALCAVTPALADTKAYSVTELVITNQDGFTQDFGPKVSAVIEKCGGRFIAATNTVLAVKGEAPKARIVIVEYPSLKAAQACYGSEAYKALLPLRDKVATGPTYLVEGNAD